MDVLDHAVQWCRGHMLSAARPEGLAQILELAMNISSENDLQAAIYTAKERGWFVLL